MLHKQPHLKHLKKYKCRAYPLIKNLPKKKKMTPKAFFDYLMSYDNTNIFLIWILSQRKVIRTRDVLFNEKKFYKQRKPDLMQLIEEPMIDTSYYEVPNASLINVREVDEVEDDMNDFSTLIFLANVEISKHSNEGKKPDVEKPYTGYPTPEGTPLPDSSAVSSGVENTAKSSSIQSSSSRFQRKFAPDAKASKNITSKLDESNIISEKMKRVRKRKETYSAALDFAAASLIGLFHAAFAAGIAAVQYYDSKGPEVKRLIGTAAAASADVGEKRLHRDTMPSEPQYYSHLKNHSYASRFRDVIKTEIDALIKKKTWIQINADAAMKAERSTVFMTWAFKYKFDDQDYLTKFKARFCVRGDLQQTDKNTYAATLEARIFRSLMSIVNAFDLKIRQYDALNVFVNSDINEDIYCTPPKGWESNRLMLLLLLKALYDLKQLSALWY